VPVDRIKGPVTADWRSWLCVCDGSGLPIGAAGDTPNYWFDRTVMAFVVALGTYFASILRVRMLILVVAVQWRSCHQRLGDARISSLPTMRSALARRPGRTALCAPRCWTTQRQDYTAGARQGDVAAAAIWIAWHQKCAASVLTVWEPTSDPFTVICGGDDLSCAGNRRHLHRIHSTIRTIRS